MAGMAIRGADYMFFQWLHMGKELRCSVSAGKLRIHRDRTRTTHRMGIKITFPFLLTVENSGVKSSVCDCWFRNDVYALTTKIAPAQLGGEKHGSIKINILIICGTVVILSLMGR